MTAVEYESSRLRHVHNKFPQLTTLGYRPSFIALRVKAKLWLGLDIDQTVPKLNVLPFKIGEF